jgi:hypothetical protein
MKISLQNDTHYSDAPLPMRIAQARAGLDRGELARVEELSGDVRLVLELAPDIVTVKVPT